MEIRENNITPFEPTHPGELIRDEINAREDLTQRELAKQLGVKPSFLNEIIKGKRSITASTALLLEEALDIPAEYWMKFQSQYEIDKARVKEKNIRKLKNVKIWNAIKEYVPIKYFKQYLTSNLEDDIHIIKKIFNISTIDDLILNAATNKFSYYRKSDKLLIDERNMLAWSSLANYEAKLQETNIFNHNNIDSLCIELNKIFFENRNTIDKTREILNQYGIKLVVIQRFEKAPIDGYSFWSEENPAIAMTLRYKRIDYFAFTLLHEIGHIYLHISGGIDKEFIDLSDSEVTNEKEYQANDFAQQKLIPLEIWEEIIKHSPLNDNRITKLGNKFGINPAIILGRLSYEKNNYAIKTKIKRKLG